MIAMRELLLAGLLAGSSPVVAGKPVAPLEILGGGVALAILRWNVSKDLPVTCLKIDGLFVREIQSGRRDQAIVRTIEALGQGYWPMSAGVLAPVLKGGSSRKRDS